MIKNLRIKSLAINFIKLLNNKVANQYKLNPVKELCYLFIMKIQINLYIFLIFKIIYCFIYV